MSILEDFFNERIIDVAGSQTFGIIFWDKWQAICHETSPSRPT